MVRSRSERGQAIMLFVGIFSVILVIAAIVVDFGLWFAERRSAQRGADLAAAAGAQDLPLSPELAFTSACDWAAANGYPNADVDVEVFARNTPEPPVNCSGGTPALECGSDCDTVRVTVSKGAPRLFTALPFFELPDEINVGAEAVAGLTYGGTGGIGGTSAEQTIVLMNAHGLMNRGCPVNCPYVFTQEGSQALVDRLLPSSSSTHRVGYAAFHHCYSAANNEPPHYGCVPEVTEPLVVPLSSFAEKPNLTIAINNTEYYRTSANICVALLKAEALFDQANVSGSRQIVLVSDGENVDHAWLVSPGGSGFGDVPEECIPQTPFGWPEDLYCTDSRPAEEELDFITWRLAEQLKAAGTEIFVMGLWIEEFPDPCGLAMLDAGEPNCDLIGVPGVDDNDNFSNERLLRCIATSSEHYRNVNQYGIPDAFEEVASEIVNRSLLQ